MKKVILPAIIALAVSASGALAADLGKMVRKAPPPPPSPWDIGFGGVITNDYNFRGISQSNRGPSGGAYFEPRYNATKDLQFYAGVAAYSVALATKPTAEVDFYGGVRPTFGPLALDIGAIYYYYPRETQFDGITNIYANGTTTLNNTDFWEVYGKATYTFSDTFNVGGNVFYSPSWLNTGAMASTHRARSSGSRRGAITASALSSPANSAIIGWALRTRTARSSPRRPRSTCRTTRPGTLASRSPGRSSPLTCVTTTRRCRRKIAGRSPRIRRRALVAPPLSPTRLACVRAGAMRLSSPSSRST